jgi:hypothetical protein
MESVYHIVTIRVNETSWAHVWRLRSSYLGTGYDKKAHNINMVKGYLPCFLLAAAQSLLSCHLKSFQTMKRLNSDDQKQAIQTINKTVHQIVPKY